MRLLFVSHSLPPADRPMENLGGMQRVAVDLHDSLLSHPGAEVRTLVLRSPWSQRHYRTPLFLGGAFRRIKRMADRKEIDAVLFSSILTAAIAVPLRPHLRKHGVAMAAIACGLDATTPTWPYPHFLRRVFNALDLVLPISRATALACQARGLAAEKCETVLLGIRLDRFRAAADRSAARDAVLAVNPSPASLLLCSVGRLVPRKGVAWFVENAMPLLPDDVHYFVAGDGPDRERIEDTVRRRGLAARVRLLGAITDSELEQLYLGCDLFVMPNVRVPGDMEGFGLVMLEAGLCGLPTIAARLEGIADVVTEGENGHLVESGDARQFAAAVMQYHAKPEELAAASERARAHTAARFGWSGVTDRYVEALRGLVERTRSG